MAEWTQTNFSQGLQHYEKTSDVNRGLWMDAMIWLKTAACVGNIIGNG